ncbi:MAG: DUF1540 domain-containing protein [Clostridia bacterium]|nr:DUF1540 domain-containing protein [Clostridia bacterium]
MDKSNSRGTLRNVKCGVDCCCFNTCDGKCTAESIEVTPRGATGHEGTDCATFIEREDY